MPERAARKIAIVTELLTRIGRMDFDGAGELLDEDALMVFPYVEQIGDVRGRQAIIGQMRATMPGVLEAMHFTFDAWYPVAEPDMVIAEYRSRCPRAGGAGVYENAYVGFFGFRGDRIALYKEYLNPAKLDIYGESFGV